MYFCVIFLRCAFERQDDIPEDDDLGDCQGGGFIGRDDDSQVPDQSIPQVPPAAPQQPPPPMQQPRALDDAMPAYWHTAYKGAHDPYGETHQAYMVYNKTELLWERRIRFHLRRFQA